MIRKMIIFLLRNKRLITSLLVIATMGILLITLIPSQHLGESDIYQYDILGHFFLFFSWTLVFGLYSFAKNLSNSNLLIIFSIAAGFGLGIEILQEMLPYGRNGNVYDLLADIAGSLLATITLYRVKSNYIPNDLN